jgi:hypothetical protein
MGRNGRRGGSGIAKNTAKYSYNREIRIGKKNGDNTNEIIQIL